MKNENYTNIVELRVQSCKACQQESGNISPQQKLVDTISKFETA